MWGTTRRGRAARRVAAAISVAALAALAACSSDDSNDAKSGSAASQSSGAGGGKGDTAQLEFWGWAPGYDKVVEAFNASHPDVHVTFNKIDPGSKGGYAKMLAAVKAGNAPCLGQVGYETLPSFLVEGALADVTKEAAAAKAKYAPGAWSQMGVAGHTYGIPVDTGPVALFYRTDVFQKYNLTPPKTWDEFAQQADKVKAGDPAVAYSAVGGNDPWWLAGMAWQNGGSWFGTSGDTWKVSMTEPGTQKAMQYWQGLLDKKVVAADPTSTPDWYKRMQDGTFATYVGPVWFSALLEENAKGAAGKWAVAPMPTWDASSKATSNIGGSGTAVLKGCKNTQAAVTFADWMSSDPASLATLVKETGIYPAAAAGADLDALKQPSAYFNNQKIYDVFKESAANIPDKWQWGPTMTQVSSDLTDLAGKAASGGGPLTGALSETQAKTLKAIQDKGLKAAAG
ncbi:ABC transporter substrate-binding protein [Yinghuangia seranimata]|uniref:ABC transporter substrate-binding protein n=1 Tax=Yinghuangia seranimata TaxID=408067 RepID=UPI00248B2FAC|nr:sugar ABC transporter substrate-binding protein [Yinghuangia seranimata]MDI2125498.1 sugar ABC transporter substrate-binding protein [Yinghuangia seranimata]